MATAKEKLIASAQKLVEKGAFEKAIKEYLRVVQEDSADVRIWLKIGDLYAKIGKKPEATDTYQRVAQFYSDQGFYLKSVAVYKQILKLEPRLVDVNQRLAELYKQLGLISDAINQYEQVASFFHKEGKVPEALGAMKQIVELDPETVAARIKLAEMYSRENMPREAIDEFTRAAEQLKEQQRVDEYMKVAERLLFHAPDNRPVTKDLARLYIEKNDPRRALPKLQVLFKADPRDLDVLRLLGRAFEGLEQRPKAVSVYKELARILGEAGDARGALEVFRQILVIEPDDADAHAALKGAQPAKGGSGLSRGRRPTPPPPSPPASGMQRALQSTAPARVHNTGAERALDSGGARVLHPPAREPAAGRDPEQPTARSGQSYGSSRSDPLVPEPMHAEPQQARDVVSEEIAKILSETDVYIKYNLHAKAIEHLQRVFERAPRHTAAREKLKALYITTGRRDDAILELWALAEQAEPGRARRYVREIYELDASNARAAQILGEPVRTPGHVAPEPEDDFGVAMPDDYALPTTSGGRNEPQTRRGHIIERRPIEEDDLEPHSDSIELESDLVEESGSAASLPIGVGEVYAEEQPIAFDEEDDLIPVVVDTGAQRVIAAELANQDEDDRFSLDEEPEPEPAAVPVRAAGDYEHAAPDAQTRFGGPQAIADFAPAQADEDSFASFEGTESTGTSQMSGSELPAFDDDHDSAMPPHEPELAGASTDDGVAADELEAEALDPVPLEVSKGSGRRGVPAPTLDPIRAESSLEDDLDESDFFMQQSLFDEARSILDSLLDRYPNHPLVLAKLRDLEAFDVNAAEGFGSASTGEGVTEDGAAEAGALSGSDPAIDPLESDAGSLQAGSLEVADIEVGLDSGAIEAESPEASPLEPYPLANALSAQLPTDLPGSGEVSDIIADTPSGEPVEVTRRGVIERGVSAEDFETHYDLGIAYKEMGLIDDAIAEFRIVMKDPAREVQCQLMIGLCYLEKQAYTEAINQFKKGLYVEGITDDEALALYYELGQAYEKIGDPREALYYYDKVQKRDPKFRDLPRRMRALRGDEAAEAAPPARSDELDAAFDSLLDEP